MITRTLSNNSMGSCLNEWKRRCGWFSSRKTKHNPVRVFADCAAELVCSGTFDQYIVGWNEDTGRSDGAGMIRPRGSIAGTMQLTEAELQEQRVPFVCVGFDDAPLRRSMRSGESLACCILGWRFGFECKPGETYGRDKLYHTDSLRDYLKYPDRENDMKKMRKIDLDKNRR